MRLTVIRLAAPMVALATIASSALTVAAALSRLVFTWP